MTQAGPQGGQKRSTAKEQAKASSVHGDKSLFRLKNVIIGLTAEEVTALRRKERKQFKVDRAQAILDASLAAEAILAGKLATPIASPGDSLETAFVDAGGSGLAEPSTSGQKRPIARINVATTTSTVAIPDFEEYAHIMPDSEARLTPQTFLVRPTRPDQRVKRPRPPAASIAPGSSQAGPHSTSIITPINTKPGSVAENDELPEVKDAEHLQLNMEEAIFLAWAIGCLDIIDARTVRLSI